MDSMEITKFVAGICGSLLVFLLMQTVAHSIYDTESHEVAYSIAVEDSGAEGEDEADAIDVDALVAEADVAKGEKVFKKCAACHKVDGSNAVGPHLDGVVGRDIGAADGFSYSGALTSLEGNWDAANLFGFLENPKGFASGTSMAFAGLKKPDDRANLISYLASISN